MRAKDPPTYCGTIVVIHAASWAESGGGGGGTP